MGLFDTIRVPCPKCGEKADFQTKGGECDLATYELADAPADAMSDVNRHAPQRCEKCATWFEVSFKLKMEVSDRRVVIVDAPTA